MSSTIDTIEASNMKRRFRIINDLNHSNYGLYNEAGEYLRMVSRREIKFWFGPDCSVKLAAAVDRYPDRDEYWLVMFDGDIEI